MDIRKYALLKAGFKPDDSDAKRLAKLVQEGVKQGVREALAEVEQQEPDPFNAMDGQTSARDMAAAYPGAEGVAWRDPMPGSSRTPSAKLSASERLRVQRRAEQIEQGRVDLRSASPERAERRLRQLGVDGVLIGDLGLRPPAPPAPPKPEDDASRDAARLEKARRELAVHERIEKSALRWPIDTSILSADAYALYLKKKGFDLNAPTLGSGVGPSRDGGK